VTLGVWDTAGQERYESMSRIYYRSAKATIVCFDLTDAKSFDKVKFWVDELLSNEEDCDIYVVGTKLDLVQEGTDRGRSQQEVKEYANKINAKVFETSSKTGEGIEQLFQDIADVYILRMTNGTHQQEGFSKVKINTPEEKQKKCCG